MPGSRRLSHGVGEVLVPSAPTALRGLNERQIRRDIIVIGASAGSIQVLSQIFSELPGDLNAIVALVLHRGPLRSELARVLGRASSLPILEPEDDERLRTNMIFLAPPDRHIEMREGRLIVHRGPKEHSTRPAVDPLFRSAAASFKSRVCGLVLSGGGDDGVNGLIAIKQNGGICLAQDPAEADIPHMPWNAIKYDNVDASLPVKALASTLEALARGDVIH